MGSRLKSLELSGYKTFASRTVFEFADTVTSIVGPNGSGKSNIGDSLRWVLGEQSYRLLRGKKTEDMIFSGSESRSQAGMAYATITFDNNDGWLPIDFNEVAITRRAYRDGQNEYLINGQRVRLMDVSELLAQSGLAERTYTIIGQGLVDAALSLRADERRRLFEEAAGIGLHRSRREDAIRRLEATQRNLERVQDILIELRPRLRSLERQVNRAEEYEEAASELSDVLRQWYGFHWHNSQEALSRAHNNSEQYEKKLMELQHEEVQISSSIEGIQSGISDCRNRLNKWNEQKDTLRSKREVVSREIAVGNERKGWLQEQKRDTSGELERIQQRLSIQKELLISTKEEFDLIERNNKSITQKYEELKISYDNKHEKRGKLELSIDDLNEEQIKLKSKRETLLSLIETRHSRNQSLEKELNNTKVRLEGIEENSQNAADTIGKIKELLKNEEQRFSTIKSNSENSEKTKRKIEDKIQKLKLEIASLNNQHEQLLVKIQLLKQSESSLEGYPEGSRVLLNASKEKKISGITGVLHQIIGVDKEHETAIAAALAMYIDAILLKNDPDIALDILLENSAKGVILPIDSIVSDDEMLLSKDEDFGSGVIGIASELINYPVSIKNIVDYFLGNVLIVNDRKTAKRVTANQIKTIVAVTLDGEAFSSKGPIISFGTKYDSKDNSLLGRSAQIEKLIKELSGIEKKIGDFESELIKLEGELEAQTRIYDDLGSELVDVQEKIRMKKEEEREQTVLLERLDWQINWCKNEILRIENEKKENDQEIKSSSVEIKKIEELIPEVDRKYNDVVNELGNLDQELLQDHYTTARTEYALSARSLADSEKLLNDKKLLIAEIESSYRELAERIIHFEEEYRKLEEELIKEQESENEIQKQLEELELVIHEEEQNLIAVEYEREELSKLSINIRKRISEVDQLFTNAKIEVARQRESVENLRKRIEDDLGLVAFEYADEVSGPYPLPIDGFVEQLPVVEVLPPDYEKSLRRLRSQIRQIGPINPEVSSEYEAVKSRYEFLINQIDDLKKADADVRHVIKELDQLMEEEFCRTFENVAEEFEEIFSRLFGGGSAHLILSDPSDITNTGIEIDARLPGRRTQGLTLLSGGERSLTAIALVFGLIRVSPTPFCLLDEVDAMLDEANSRRFRALLKEMSQKTQFVVVTHNRNTVEAADIIYGVTMGRDSTSQVLSLKIDELSKVID